MLAGNVVHVVNILHQSFGFCCGYSVFFVRQELPSCILGFQGLISVLLLIRSCINEPHSHLEFFLVNFSMARKRVEEPWEEDERAYVLDITRRITECKILCW